MSTLTERLKNYAKEYRTSPLGREVQGTAEIMEEAVTALNAAQNTIDGMNIKYVQGMDVHRQGLDESDGIECPVCKYEVARNDDYREMCPKHCPECGTKLIY